MYGYWQIETEIETEIEIEEMGKKIWDNEELGIRNGGAPPQNYRAARVFIF